MFRKWNKNRVLKKLQEECFHEYHVIATYEVFVGDEYSCEWLIRHDIYCPICDKTAYKVTPIQAEREAEKQKVRNKYNETR